MEITDFSLWDIQRAWSQAVNAVRIVHGKGVVHFDIKPENFLCFFKADDARRENVILKLADFGVSVKMRTGCTHISKDTPVGTIKYMAPETIYQVGGRINSFLKIFFFIP